MSQQPRIKNSMAASKDNREATFRRSRIRLVLFVVAACLAVYIFGLMNPLTGPWLQYPYYKLACDKDPIVADSFMNRRYFTPDMKNYESKIRGASALYCTEEDALRAGYHKA